MKLHCILLLLTISCSFAYSQEKITGLWYSPDSSRIYKIYQKEQIFEAVLVQSTRQGDTAGVLVLSNITSNQKKELYTGCIHAVDDHLTTQVKMRQATDGKTLKLTLRRMFFFPVNIEWYKVN
jgi:hypothetical protein